MDAENKLLDKVKDTTHGPKNNGCPEKEGPDGGWGWVVCFACFMECVLFDGIFYSFGITFLELADHFETSQETGAWILSLNLGICMTIGPFIAALCNKFGFRLVTICGTLITFTGLVLSCFAKSPQFLYFSYGIVAGVGYGMVSLPSITAVTLCFTTKRSLATGLAICGNGVGVFIMSPVTERLVRHYTWSGTFLIQAGILLNGIICGLTYRSFSSNKFTMTDSQNIEIKQISTEIVGTDLKIAANGSKSDEGKVCGDENAREEVILTEEQLTANDEPFLQFNPCHSVKDTVGKPSLDESESNIGPSKRTLIYLVTNATRKTKTSILNVIVDTFDMSLMKNVPFCLYTISSTLYSLTYYVPFFYLPDLAKQEGIDSFRGAWLLSAIGITSMVCRVVFGVLSDMSCVNRLNLYSVCVFLCGLVIIVIPFCRSFEILFAVSLAFGLFQGVTAVLATVLIADIVGTQDTCKGLGIQSLFAGLATFVGPPLAGLMYDVTRSYNVTFLVSGAITSASGAFLFTIPCLKYIRHTNTET